MSIMWAAITVVVGFLGFFLAKWLRARADAASAAEGLRIRLAERRRAATWLLALSGALYLFIRARSG